MGKRGVETRALFLIGALVALLCSSTAYPRFRFQGDISGSWEFNNNINSSPTNPISDSIWTVSPSFSVTKGNAQRSIVANFGFSSRNYLKTIKQDRDTFTGGLSGHYSLSRRTAVDFYETLSYSPKVTTQSVNFVSVFTDAGIVTQLVTSNTASSLISNGLGASISHELTRRTTLTFSGTMDLGRFSSKAFSNTFGSFLRAGVSYKLSRRDVLDFSVSHGFSSFGNKVTDTTTDTAGLEWHRELTRVLRGQASVYLTDARTKIFSSNTITGSQSARFRVGGRYIIDPNTQLVAEAGVNITRAIGNAQTTGSNMSAAPDYDISLARRFVHSSITANLRQTFSTGFATGFSTAFEGLTYAYEFSPDLTMDVNLSRSASKSSSKTGANAVDVSTVALYVRLSYKIDRRTFFTATYSGVNQTSKGGNVGGNISQKVLILSIDILDLTRRRP
jgi:hypothetical protein